MIQSAPLKKLQINDNTLTLKTGFYRNISFLILFALLFIAVIMNLSYPKDLSGSRLPGTIVIFLLLLVSAIMSLHRWEMIAENNTITIRHNFYIFCLGQRQYTLNELENIELKKISPGGLKRYEFYQLFLHFKMQEGKTKSEMILSTTDFHAINEIAEKMKQFFF